MNRTCIILTCFAALTACSQKSAVGTAESQNAAVKPLLDDSKSPPEQGATLSEKDIAGIKKSFEFEDWQTGVTFEIVGAYQNIYAVAVSRHKAGGIFFCKKSPDGKFAVLDNKLPTNYYLDIDEKAYRIPEGRKHRLDVIYPECSKFDKDGNMALWLVVHVIDEENSEDEENRYFYYINKYTISAKDEQLKISTRSVGEVYTDEQRNLMDEMRKKDGVG